MPLPVDVESQPPLLTLACRFIPYDQWLTTHVDAGWKVKQVKLWILSKCLGIPLDASVFPFPSVLRAANPDRLDGSILSGQRYRPKSPITFAPDPRTLRRPISPILFAKGKDRKGKGKAEKDDNAQSTEPTPTGSPVDGYEEDDEWDVADDGGSSSDELAIYRSSPPPPLPVPPPPRPPTPVPLTHPQSSKWARYTLSSSSYTLIRFSTGQALEDDLALTFFDLSSYELLELHAHGDVCSLRQNSPSSPMNTVSHVPTSDHGHGVHTRNNSIYSLSSTTTTSSPPPSFSSHSKTKDTQHSQPIYLASLNRHDIHTYILPYWEGPVRELRSVPLRSFVGPMPNPMNGYGYGYSGTEISERAIALGIGHPPPFGMHGQGMRGAGGWDARVVGAGVGVGGEVAKVQSRIEWRAKHVVIKEGLFTLCMSREDPNPRHIIPLEAFTSLRGADTLLTYLRSRDHPRTASTSTSTFTTTTTAHQPYSSYSNYATPNPSQSSHGFQNPHTRSRYSTSTLGGPVFSSLASDHDSGSEIGSAARRRHGQVHRKSDDSGPHSYSHFHPYQNNNNEDHDSGAPQTVAGEPIDDLHIVVLRFRSVDRLKKVVSMDRDGLVRCEYVRDKERGEERERERQGEGKGGEGKKKKKKKKDKKGEEERKRKGRAFPWEREGKDKDKGKMKERRDWIPGFGGKRDRDREAKDKDKEKDRSGNGGVSLGGLGMGVSLGRGMQDVREKAARERERERGKVRERVALSETDAEAKIVFARRSEAGTSEEDRTGVGEVDGAMEDGEDGGKGLRRRGKGKSKGTDKGKGKGKRKEVRGKVKAKAKVEVGEADVGADADVDADADADGDSDLDADDSPFSHARTKSSSSHSHSHPYSELAGANVGGDGGGGDDDDDGESEAWSSPVFAHSDNNHTTDLGSDGEWSDIGLGGPKHGHHGGDAYRYGYRYGYQGPGLGLEGGRVEAESVGEEKDRLEKERANMERRREKERARKEEEVRRRENERTEWIILDLGSDLAYRSFLRVLHRHLAPTAPSEFIPSAPVFSVATPTSTTPTQTPTPFPSPTSPHAGAMSSSQWLPSSDEDTPMDSASSTLTASFQRDSHSSPISASSEASGQEFPQHPASLASLSQTGTRKPQPFGVLPYPEWRLELTERAQRAGMGNVGRAMKWVQWESRAQLELDIEEILRRHGARDDASDQASRESIRKKKKKATSLKNRRRSTTSTLTGGKGKGVLKDKDGEGLMYDSDVSEDTGKMLEMSMSDSEEGSEAEWHGWMADLHRQRQMKEKRAREETERKAMEVAEAVAAFEASDGDYGEPADGTDIRNMRVRLEPKGVISVRPPEQTGLPEGSGLAVSQSTTATLYSPSSSDSLRRGAFSPIDRSSSPTGTFVTNSQNSRGSSLSPSPLGVRKSTFPVGPSLSHSTSMYASIRPDAHAADLRRPSMPILTSDQIFSLHQGPIVAPHSSVIRSPVAPKYSFPSSTTYSPPYSPTFTFPAEDVLPNAASSSQSPSEPSFAMSRRASSAGLTNTGGSLSRSASVLTRGGLLRRDAVKEAERLREKERRKEEKAKEKEDKAKEKERAKESEREAKEARKLQRPKLSLATSSTYQLVPSQPATGGVMRTNPKVETGRSLMRRVKSGSNLNEEIMIDQGRMPDLAKDASNAHKKRRGVFVNRIVRGLDSAMDFVDGLS